MKVVTKRFKNVFSGSTSGWKSEVSEHKLNLEINNFIKDHPGFRLISVTPEVQHQGATTAIIAVFGN